VNDKVTVIARVRAKPGLEAKSNRNVRLGRTVSRRGRLHQLRISINQPISGTLYLLRELEEP